MNVWNWNQLGEDFGRLVNNDSMGFSSFFEVPEELAALEGDGGKPDTKGTFYK